MKMKQFGEFLKKNVFYVAMGLVVIATVFAVFFMPNNTGNVDPSAYEPKEATIGNAEVPSSTPAAPSKSNNVADGANISEDVAKEVGASNHATDEVVDTATNDNNESSENVATIDEANGSDNTEQEAVTETFESTTAKEEVPPFFAENDTFVWPINGEIVVPYTDESTKYWYSESLNQTMRTFGICIQGEEGQEVKAIAKGTVTDILDDSSELQIETGMPYVGKVMVLDHGNGYRSIYGFQKGTPNKALKGQVVNVGDVLGTVGDPEGAFLAEGDNIYLQVTHNDVTINPQTRLEEQVQVSQSELEQ